MPNPATARWVVDLWIGGDTVNLSRAVVKFEWKSMVNGGFIVRARLEDPYFALLEKYIEGDSGLLRSGRQHDNPTLVTFRMRWDTGYTGPKRVALVTDMQAIGDRTYSGGFEFIAVDPVSYYINSGDASGKMYKGKIGGKGGIIDQVIKEYAVKDISKLGYSLEVEVGDTTDQENTYWQMRQDPKTFIGSLLEWSSSLTKHKTSWIVANGQDTADYKKLKIEVKESHTSKLSWPKDVTESGSIIEGRPLVLRYGGPPQQPIGDIHSWSIVTNNFLSALNTKLVTSGISSISGEYLDTVVDTDEKFVSVKDDNTENKPNPKLKPQQAFKKPINDERGWSHVQFIPEFNGGDLGVPYKEYISGRARKNYLDLLNLLMRIKVTVRGQPRLFDSTELGRTKVNLKWLKIQPVDGPQQRFTDGDWLMYGWHHRCSNTFGWETDVFLMRLDYDAKAVGG